MLAIGAISALVLSGCDTSDVLFSDSFELQILPTGRVSVAVCDKLHVEFASGDVYHEETGKWSRFWQATGDADIQPIALAEVGDSTFGLEASVNETPKIHPGDQISIDLIDNSGSSAAHGGFIFKDPSATQNLWMNTDGELSASPCSGRSPTP